MTISDSKVRLGITGQVLIGRRRVPGATPFVFDFSNGARSVAFKNGTYLCPQKIEK